MKKLFMAVAAIAMFLLCLTACSSGPDVKGEWRSSAEQGIDLGMGVYEFKMVFNIDLILDSNNKYSLLVNASDDSSSKFEEILRLYVDENIQAIMEQEEVTEEEAIELIEESSKMAMEEYIAGSVEEFEASLIEGATTISGTYKVSGNNLTLTDETGGESVFNYIDGKLVTTEANFGELEFVKVG